MDIPGYSKCMESVIENIVIYSLTGTLFILIFWWYLRKQKKNSQKVAEKIKIAKEEGLYEPVSLHPVVDINSCIKTGACISACPEKDILGILNGKATTINASRCVGHGACFHACPTQAITLCIGTEKRGVELPHVNQQFETNVQGIYVAGEMGGMGLIKNAVEQGKQAVENLHKTLDRTSKTEYDVIVVGAGPAGISATLQAKKLNLKSLTLEQDSLGGTVFTFPRAKLVMTSPMDLPLHGKIKLPETNKTELLKLWGDVIEKNGIQINEHMKVENISGNNGNFLLTTESGESFTTQKIVLAIGRRGSPRKLNVEGEESEKVAYRLLEPENIMNKNILVVGGGDSAIESALLLCDNNTVTLSYRKEVFNRIKPKNKTLVEEAIQNQKFSILYNSNLREISTKTVSLSVNGNNETIELENDLVYIFAGGELPTQFLEKAGIKITRKFGDAILKHNN